MDLKHTTKAELWRSYQQLEKNYTARIDELSAALDKTVKEKEALTEELRLVDAARKETLRDLKDTRKELDAIKDVATHMKDMLKKSNEDLADATKREADLFCDLRDTREDVATLNALLGEKERYIDGERAKVKVLVQERDSARTLAESYKRGLDWCIEHPWENVWKCWKEKLKGW